MSNRVVKIVKQVLQLYIPYEEGYNTDETAALDIIAALEKEGYKVMGSEPTAHMLDLALLLWVKPEEAGTLWSDIHDAAPRYGEREDR